MPSALIVEKLGMNAFSWKEEDFALSDILPDAFEQPLEMFAIQAIIHKQCSNTMIFRKLT